MDNPTCNHSTTDLLVSSSNNKLSVLTEDDLVQSRKASNKRRNSELLKNRLSQRASILCMCQCESGECVPQFDQNTEQPHVHCELHKPVDSCKETETMMDDKMANCDSVTKPDSITELSQTNSNHGADCVKKMTIGATSLKGVESPLMGCKSNKFTAEGIKDTFCDVKESSTENNIEDRVNQVAGVINDTDNNEDRVNQVADIIKDIDNNENRVVKVTYIRNDTDNIEDRMNQVADIINDTVNNEDKANQVTDNINHNGHTLSNLTEDSSTDIERVIKVTDLVDQVNQVTDIINHTDNNVEGEMKVIDVVDHSDDTLSYLTENCEGSMIIDGFINFNECAPDVYGSECLASISASCSLTSINAVYEDVDHTGVDTIQEQTDLNECEHELDQQRIVPSGFDETLKGTNEELDDCDSEDSEVELEQREISVDDVDLDTVSDDRVGDGENEETCITEEALGLLSAITMSEIVPVRLKIAQHSSGPLCASTPLLKNVSKDSKYRQVVEEDSNNYPTLSSFKPQSSLTNIVIAKDNTTGTYSLPLCSSTPIVKQVPGLQGRTSNTIEEEKEKGSKRNIIHDILGLDSCIDDGVDSQSRNVDDVVIENVYLSGKIDKLSKDKKKVSLKKKEAKKDGKKTKETRTKKFKEYLGPGLTCNPNEENDVENSKPKDFLKNTDIELCTLTEYKGLGLTGPLLDKPLHASTPAPIKGLTVRDTNIMNSESGSHKRQPFSNVGLNIPNSVFDKDVRNRPAGMEGFLLTSDGKYPGLKRTNSCQSSTITRPLYRHFSQQLVKPNTLINQKHVSLPTLTNRPANGPSLDPALLLPLSEFQGGSSGQVNSGTSSALQPDDIYPSMASVRSDRSDNHSTDRSDRSSKSGKPFDSSVLQSYGQLKVSAYMNFGLLTVHVVQGRQLSTKWKSSCDSFVKMCLIPDDGKKPKCKTCIVQDSNNPLFDEKFSFELNDEDHCKRLMISVWHRDQNASVNEFLGCMSFGVRHLTNPKKEVSGWYYLLTEDIGRKKHLKVTHRQVPQLKVRHQANIPAVNKDVWGTETHNLTIYRGKNGFGFSVVEACPVRVGRVDGTSPAESAGLQPGDIIIRLNKQNVSRSTATSVAKLVKTSSNTLFLEIHRQKPITFEHLENNDPQNNDYVYEMNENNYSVPDMNTINYENKENTMADETIYGLHPSITSLATSTPLPLLARGHRTVQTSEMRKQEAIHRLLSLELDFIDLMHAGMQRYSRPLRHCILSHSQHIALFQNIEKLTTISEYHVKQMHDNAPSSFVSEDTDTSVTSDNHNFLRSIGLIYQSKVHMLCQAYDLYAKGVSKANQILSDLQHNEDFMKFIHDPSLDGNQPSINMFVYQPVKHVRDLYTVIKDIFMNTSHDSSDYNSLKQVVEGLQECATSITNYSCERIESVSSLASRESKSSFTSSMKSQSSSCSSRSTSSKGHSSGRSCSMQTSKSIDTEVMKIQDKLVFSSNVPVFQLCQDDRHIVFSGDMFKWEGHQWVKVHMILFTDMILLTMKEADGYLRVLQEPTMLRDVTGMDAQRHHGTELVLYCKPKVHSNKKLSLRAPSTEQKYAWKSLIEQRVFAVRGSLEYYSSTSDVSSSSASAIII